MLGSSAMFGGSQSFGGFGESQAPMAASPEPTAKKAREEKQTCLPVTIRAIEHAAQQRLDTSDDLKFYGSEPSALVLVAAVESVVRQSTGLEMTLNDATGRIKARYFVTDAQPGELEQITPGTYISVFGGVRSAPTTHLAINGLRRVESADEVSYHMIEVAHAMLSLQQPAKGVAVETPVPKRAPVGAGDLQSPDKRLPADTTPAAAPGVPLTTPGVPAAPVATPELAAAPAPQAAAPAGPLKGVALNQAILALLRDESVDPGEGLALEVFAAKIPAASADDIKLSVKEMVAQGEIFNSIDDNHFLAL